MLDGVPVSCILHSIRRLSPLSSGSPFSVLLLLLLGSLAQSRLRLIHYSLLFVLRTTQGKIGV